MSKRARPVATKTTAWKKKKVMPKAKFDRMDLFSEPRRELVKREDVQISATVFNNSNTQTATSIFSVGQGSDVFQRVGNTVHLVNITVRGSIVAEPPAMAATDQFADTLRLVLFYDKQPNQGTPRFVDVVGVTGAIAGADPLSPANFNQRDRFLILKNWQIQTPAFHSSVAIAAPAITNVGPNAPTSEEFVLKFFKNFKKKLAVIYNGTGTTTASQVTGGLFVVGQCFAANSPWVYSMTTAVEYVDA